MSQEERWQLSGRAAEFYEQYATHLMEPWVRSLIDIAALRPGERVLDSPAVQASLRAWPQTLSG